MANLFSVKDKVVVMTGAAGILGRTISSYLAGEGAKMVILDRNEEAGNELVNNIKAAGNEAIFLYTDVLNKEVLLQNKKDIMYCLTQQDVIWRVLRFLPKRRFSILTWRLSEKLSI